MISEKVADSNAGAAASSSGAAATPPEHCHPSAGPRAPGPRLFDTQLRRSDLANRKPVRVKREGKDIVCVLVDETVYAFKNRCPHTGYLLHEGRIRGCVVTCISHLAQFDLRDGHVVTLPMEGRSIETGPLAVYPVVEQDGILFAELPED
jgi:3-phenylpropionate/trans-cinnamate dioxygenase ferredoxin subunit